MLNFFYILYIIKCLWITQKYKKNFTHNQKIFFKELDKTLIEIPLNIPHIHLLDICSPCPFGAIKNNEKQSLFDLSLCIECPTCPYHHQKNFSHIVKSQKALTIQLKDYPYE